MSTVPRVAVATLLAAAAGAGVGSALAHDPPPRPAAPDTPRVGMASGAARLPLPAGWVPLNRHSTLPGFHDATAVRGTHATVALDIRSPEDPSLLPADVLAATGGSLPAPRIERLDRRRAWRYELPEPRTNSTVVAMALPTTGGVVTIACQPDARSTTGAADDCSGAMRALRLVGASELAPAPEAAARIVLPGIVASLNRQRRRERRDLGASRSPHERGEAARRLAEAYRNAANALRPLAAGDAGRLTRALSGLVRQHDQLAAASRRREAGAARRSSAAIERGERRLQPLLAAVSGSGHS
jgi:hypothetical protein